MKPDEAMELYGKLDIAVAALKVISKFETMTDYSEETTLTKGDAVSIAQQALSLIFPRKEF